jgi:multidrug resistance efflux pump
MALVQLKDQYQSTNIAQQIGSLKQQQHLTEQLSASLQQQVIKLEEEVSLAEKNYRDFEGLFKTGAASEIEKDAAKTTWLAIQRLQESKKAEVLQNQVDLNRITASINTLEHTAQLRLKDYANQVHQQKFVLAGQVEAWKSTHMLRAPVAGSVVFPARRFVGQFLEAETFVFGLADLQNTPQVLAIGQLAGGGVGKVEKDMEVLIRLQAFPHKQFGELEGRVGHIGVVPVHQANHTFYEIAIHLPGQLETNFEKQLSYRAGLPGTARIITEDRSLLSRFLSVFKY